MGMEGIGFSFEIGGVSAVEGEIYVFEVIGVGGAGVGKSY